MYICLKNDSSKPTFLMVFQGIIGHESQKYMGHTTEAQAPSSRIRALSFLQFQNFSYGLRNQPDANSFAISVLSFQYLLSRGLTYHSYFLFVSCLPFNFKQEIEKDRNRYENKNRIGIKTEREVKTEKRTKERDIKTESEIKTEKRYRN